MSKMNTRRFIQIAFVLHTNNVFSEGNRERDEPMTFFSRAKGYHGIFYFVLNFLVHSKVSKFRASFHLSVSKMQLFSAFWSFHWRLLEHFSDRSILVENKLVFFRFDMWIPAGPFLEDWALLNFRNYLCLRKQVLYHRLLLIIFRSVLTSQKYLDFDQRVASEVWTYDFLL